MARIGDSVTFSLNITRTDERLPVYSISLLAGIFHPLESVLNTTFDPSKITLIDRFSNETLTMLSLAQLSYSTENAVIDHSRLLLDFEGVITSVVYFIQLRGFLKFQSTPTNGYTYDESITFPEVFIRNVEFLFNLLSSSSELTEGALVVLREETVWVASLNQVAGPSANLSLLVELNDTNLNITNVAVVQIG